jgi:hypothetical protein
MTPDATPPDDALLALPPAAEFSLPPPPRRRGRAVLFAGVAGACALGAGLGLWARPGMSERRLAIAPPAAATAVDGPARTLQVVVDDRPAPLGAPLEVLPATARAATSAAPPMALPVFTSPVRQPEPLVRVEGAPPPRTVQIASEDPPAPPKPFLSPKLAPMIAAALAAPRTLITRLSAPEPPPILLAKGGPDPKPAIRPDRAAARAAAHRIAQAQAAKKEAAEERAAQAEAAREQAAETRLAKAEASKAKAAQIKLAKADATRIAKADHLAKLAQSKIQAKADKAEAIRLARAEARGRAEARAEAKTEALAEARDEAKKQFRLASLVRTLRRVLPHEAPPQPAPVHTAKLDRRHGKKGPHHEPVVERASLKTHRPPHLAGPPSRGHAVDIAQPQHPSGLMKVSATRCGQRDPGEALVCADPNLGAADRQLARAYQGARAAGVSDTQLQRQQQRWLAARSAAAREAPWAVHDVYMARIAELNGQAREAHGDGY